MKKASKQGVQGYFTLMSVFGEMLLKVFFSSVFTRECRQRGCTVNFRFLFLALKAFTYSVARTVEIKLKKI